MTFTSGLVLGAGSSSRLGQPKQLLDHGGRPLLQAALDNALAAAFDQVIVAIGGSAPEVRTAVSFGDATINELIGRVSEHPFTVCRYEDGRGHPFGFRRDIFDDLADLQGDKAVWKLLESGSHRVNELAQPGPIPPDVDTWDDYQQLVENSH